MPQDARPLKVYLSCTGVGVIHRGIETFARECFGGVHGMPGLRIELFKGLGEEVPPDEHRLWCLPRTRLLARVLGSMIHRNGYVLEQLSSFLPMVRRLRVGRPDLVFTSDGNLSRWLYVFRKQIGVPFKLLFSNGGPIGPRFPYADHVQQVAPSYREAALAAGEPARKHSLVPYGIRVPESDPVMLSLEDRRSLRRRIGLPSDDRAIVLSVGAITTRDHKRMDYTIDEVASFPEKKRPFLVLLGYQDDSSAPLLARAREKLGANGFVARSVPHTEVSDYYRTADVFMLASLTEGFGRVYLEALLAGLPCVLHDYPVMRYVAGEEGTFGDLSKQGNGAKLLAEQLRQTTTADDMARRRNSVRQRFAWDVVAPKYLEMFRACCNETSVDT